MDSTSSRDPIFKQSVIEFRIQVECDEHLGADRILMKREPPMLRDDSCVVQSRLEDASLWHFVRVQDINVFLEQIVSTKRINVGVAARWWGRALSQYLSLLARRVVPLINSGYTREQLASNGLTAEDCKAVNEIDSLRLLDEGDEVFDFGVFHTIDRFSKANVKVRDALLLARPG